MSRARTFDVRVCTPSSFPSSSSSSSSATTTPSTKRWVQQPPPRCWLTLAAVVASLFFFFFVFLSPPFPRRESPRSRRCRCGSMMALATPRGFSRLPPLRPSPVCPVFGPCVPSHRGSRPADYVCATFGGSTAGVSVCARR